MSVLVALVLLVVAVALGVLSTALAIDVLRPPRPAPCLVCDARAVGERERALLAAEEAPAGPDGPGQLVVDGWSLRTVRTGDDGELLRVIATNGSDVMSWVGPAQ